MKNLSSIFSMMVVTLAIVGCNSSSGGGGGGAVVDNAVYPTPITGTLENGQPMPPQGQYETQTIRPGTYEAEVRCDNEYATENMQPVAISFSFKADGSYTQEIINVDYRCKHNCVMFADGSYSVTANSLALNQNRLVSEYGGMLQGPRSNTLQIEMTAPATAEVQAQGTTVGPKITARKGAAKAIVLRDPGSTENVCGGPFRMFLKKESNGRRH